jgi:hypothetical protein
MTYSSKYNADKYSQITDLLTQVSRLEPGGRITIKGLTPTEQARVRSLLYDWFHHMSLKARFKVKAEADRLSIIDRRLQNPITLTIETPLTSREEQELMGELIERYEEAEAVLECWVSEGKITDTRAKELRVKLEQVMS